MAKTTKEDDGEEVEVVTFESLFDAYSNFGPNSAEGEVGILLSQVDLWMKQAKIIDGNVTLTDTGMVFNKFKKRRITLQEYEQFLLDLCERKKLNIEDIKGKLFNAGMPTLAPKIA